MCATIWLNWEQMSEKKKREYLPEDDTVRYRNVVQKYCVRWKNKVVVKAKFQFSFDRIVATTSKKLF